MRLEGRARVGRGSYGQGAGRHGPPWSGGGVERISPCGCPDGAPGQDGTGPLVTRSCSSRWTTGWTGGSCVRSAHQSWVSCIPAHASFPPTLGSCCPMYGPNSERHLRPQHPSASAAPASALPCAPARRALGETPPTASASRAAGPHSPSCPWEAPSRLSASRSPWWQRGRSEKEEEAECPSSPGRAESGGCFKSQWVLAAETAMRPPTLPSPTSKVKIQCTMVLEEELFHGSTFIP